MKVKDWSANEKNTLRPLRPTLNSVESVMKDVDEGGDEKGGLDEVVKECFDGKEELEEVRVGKKLKRPQRTLS